MVEGKKRVERIPAEWVEDVAASGRRRGGSSSRRWPRSWRRMRNCWCWSGSRPGGDGADAAAAVEVRAGAVAAWRRTSAGRGMAGGSPRFRRRSWCGRSWWVRCCGSAAFTASKPWCARRPGGRCGCATLRGRRAGLLHGAAGSGADAARRWRRPCGGRSATRRSARAAGSAWRSTAPGRGTGRRRAARSAIRCATARARSSATCTTS